MCEMKWFIRMTFIVFYSVMLDEIGLCVFDLNGHVRYICGSFPTAATTFLDLHDLLHTIPDVRQSTSKRERVRRVASLRPLVCPQLMATLSTLVQMLLSLSDQLMFTPKLRYHVFICNRW